jgi:hypothetical protein
MKEKTEGNDSRPPVPLESHFEVSAYILGFATNDYRYSCIVERVPDLAGNLTFIFAGQTVIGSTSARRRF